MDDAPVSLYEPALPPPNDFGDVDVPLVPEYHLEPRKVRTRSEVELLFTRTVDAAFLAHLGGKIISPASVLAEDPGLPLDRVRELMVSPRFRHVLSERGVPDMEDGAALSDEMVRTLIILADTSLSMTQRARLREVNVSWRTFQGWQSYEPFRKKYREVMANTLNFATMTADRVLAERIEAGDMRAIEYSNELTGKYRKGSQEQASVDYYTTMVLSVLQKRVTDTPLLQAIVADLQKLAQQTGFVPVDMNVIDAEIVEDL